LIEFKQNLLFSTKEISLEILRPPDLVHYLNDVALLVQSFRSSIKHHIEFAKPLKFAFKTFEHIAQES